MIEFVKHGGTGIHFKPGDARELACIVDQVLNGQVDLISMRAAARREYEMKYTDAHNYDQLMAIYQRAAAMKN